MVIEPALGLGLYIAKEIVTLRGGRMWVASELGSGSTFSFTLPFYSLAKLLLPAITQHGRLRESIVLVRVELTPPGRFASACSIIAAISDRTTGAEPMWCISTSIDRRSA